jgi:hypothetical protein
MSSSSDNYKSVQRPGSLVEILFTDEQRRALEQATGLENMLGLRLVDLDASSRAALSPGLVRVTAMVMCW